MKKETIKTIIDWHNATFPDATLEGQIEKFIEEMNEFDESGKIDITELADMFIVVCGIARFSLMNAVPYFKRVDSKRMYNGFTEPELDDAISEKMAKNRARKWEKTGGMYKHVKEE